MVDDTERGAGVQKKGALNFSSGGCGRLPSTPPPKTGVNAAHRWREPDSAFDSPSSGFLFDFSGFA